MKQIKTHTKIVAGMAAIVAIAASVYWFNQTSFKTNALPLPDATWQTVFNDDFNGPTLSTNQWTTCYEWFSTHYNGCSNTGNNESQWYLPSQVKVEDGHALITAQKQATPGWFNNYEQIYPYRSGMIATGRPNFDTSPQWSGTYGYYEARLKVPAGQAVWPAFWLLPVDHSWPPEIDIMELLGQSPNELIMTHHWHGPEGKPAKDTSTFTSGNFTKDWHTYAVNWQPKRIDWYVDGVLRKSVSGAHVPDKPMAIIANLAVGGNLAGSPNASTPATSQMLIDYIRVRQSPENIAQNSPSAEN